MKTTSIERKKIRVIVTSILVLVLGVSSALGLWLRVNGYWQGRLCPGIYINTVPVGGLSLIEAQAKLEKQFQSVLQGQITFRFERRQFELVPSQVGIALDFRQALAQARQVGRKGSWAARLRTWICGKWINTHIELRTIVKQNQLRPWLRQVSAQVHRPAQGAKLIPEPDGQFRVEKAQIGIEMDSTKLMRMLASGLEHLPKQIPLPVRKEYPLVTEEKLHRWEIRDLLGSYTTAFDTTKPGRPHNVAVAASAVNQVLVQPDEVFSFVYNIQTKTSAEDFQEAPVMVDGELVEGKGGGICQVSTTLFNAALLANLQIVERNHHSMPVAYVPVGLDATVAGDYLDLKLRAQEHGAFYIVTAINQGQLTVYLYGKKDHNIHVAIEQSELEVVPPPTKVIKDPGGSKGMTTVKKGKQGYRVSTWRIISNKGQVKKELIAKDYYKPIPEEIYNGSGNT